MPFGDVVNQIPAPVFLLIHGVAFLIGAYFAWRAFNAGASLLGWAFSLFAHLISEVLDLVAFILVFVVASRSVLATARASA